MSDKTITRAQFEAALKAYKDTRCHGVSDLRATFAAAGIRIIDDAPPEGVVKLAREIAERETWDWPAVTHKCTQVAIAAIMHARKVVESNAGRYDEDAVLLARDILRELGGER